MATDLSNLPEAQRLLQLVRNVETAETRLRLARLVLQDALPHLLDRIPNEDLEQGESDEIATERLPYSRQVKPEFSQASFHPLSDPTLTAECSLAEKERRFPVSESVNKRAGA